MKQVVLFTALLALTGCVQVDDYQSAVKVPAPSAIVGYWQSKGPQREMVSPEAIASLIVTPEGDTLDCRQWQRTIAIPGKLIQPRETRFNVTMMRDVSRITREGVLLRYDGMIFERVEKPTPECADYLTTHPLKTL